MGAYGTIKIAMKYPSMFSSIGMMCGAVMNLEETLYSMSKCRKENMVAAAGTKDYSLAATIGIRACFAQAAAVAPDSSNKPAMVRFPFTAEGELIDSIWQRWLEHYPYTMLPSYVDSLKLLDAIQIYLGDQDPDISANESLHQALLDHGIPHGYKVYAGGHDPGPVLDNMLFYFSKHLQGNLPEVRISNEYFYENREALSAETSRDGSLYHVPSGSGHGIDSIYRNYLMRVEATANEEAEIPLAELEYGKYEVYAISQDSMVSNNPAQFIVVPDKSPPEIVIETDSVFQGVPISVTLSRKGTQCLLSCSPFFGCDT